MWAQLIKMNVKPGKEQDLPSLFDAIQSTEQPDSGLIRTMTMQDQKDPSQVYTLVVFESEEAARARGSDPRRAEGMKAAQATMGEIFDGPPEFIDLTVTLEVTP